MNIRRLALAVATTCGVCLWSTAVCATTIYNQGFEVNTDDWTAYNTITRVIQ